VSAADLAACVKPMFPAGTFETPAMPDLSPICSEPDPKKGASALRAIVISAGANRPTSDGMREWGVLGWYEMAAFATVRGHCCPGAPPIALTKPIPECTLEPSLNGLAAASGKGLPNDEKALAQVLQPYDDAILCLVRLELGPRFAKPNAIQGGETLAIKKFLARAAGGG
jgi:hypothetical protein